MVVGVIKFTEQLVHIGWGIPSSEVGGERRAMHNIVDYAIQCSDYAILHSMVIFTQLTGYMALQRGAYYISLCAKGYTWNEAA